MSINFLPMTFLSRKHIMRCGFILTMMMIVINVSAQSFVLTGYVKDQNSRPLPGALATIDRTNKLAVADENGKFLIEVNNSNDTITITNVGYITLKTVIGTATTNTFTLIYDEQKAKLDEVVVVGFGKQKKATLTGAVSSVSVSDIERSSVPQLSNAIGGKLPGIITRQSSGEPGYDQAQVFIRGVGTFAGGRTPLVFVDGIERPLNNINAMEIESFSILKDASATAVYGVRGANGVILINTKKGKQGKPRIVLRSEYAIMQAQRLPKYIDAAEYANLVNETRANSGTNVIDYTPEQIQKFKDGSDPYLYPNINWTDIIMNKQTWQTINNLNVSGGNDVVRYFTNIGFVEQNGIWKKAPNTKYNTNANLKRYNFRSNVDINVAKNFVIELGMAGIIQSQNYPGISSGDILFYLRKITPLSFPIYNPDGSLGGGSGINLNPLGIVGQSGYSRQDRNTIQGTFAAKWDLSKIITKGLELSGRFGYDHYYNGNQVRFREFPVRRYYKDGAGNDQYQIVREERPMAYSDGHTANKSVYYEAKLNYDRKFNNHGIAGMLLFNQGEYVNLTAGSSVGNLPYRRRGYAGRLTYDYLQKYLLEGNFGYNGSENFTPENKYGFFPSVSAGWVISKESFWGDDNPVSLFKIRGSYGLVGNDKSDLDRFFFQSRTFTKRNPDQLWDPQSALFGPDMIYYQGITEDKIGFSGVTWETAKKTNIGVDIEMFGGKISLQADVFNEDRSGILMPREDLPIFTGIYPWSRPIKNIGKANNRGIDGMLEVKNSTSYGLYYSFRSTFTYAKNKIIDFGQPPTKYTYQSNNGRYIGQPYALVALGLFKDQADIDNSPVQKFQDIVRPGDIKFKDINGDGLITSDDRMFVGYPRDPQMVYGFGGTIAYKNFDFSVFFNGAARTNIFFENASIYVFNESIGANNVLREYYDNRFVSGGNNENALYPIASDKSQNNFTYRNTLYMRDGSFLRLKNAEFGYTIPKLLTDRWKMQSIRFFINGLNLYTWDKVKIIDPESNSGTGGYPLTRNFNFGIQANF